MGIIKNLFKRNQDINLALLDYRNSPIISLGYSPSQLLNNRRLRSKLPISNTLLEMKKINQNEVYEKLLKNQNTQKQYFVEAQKI